MHRPFWRWGAGCGLLAALLLAALPGGEAQARQGFYLGGGPTLLALSGDIDGKKMFVNTAGNRAYLIGELDTGAGLQGVVGYGFNQWVGVEASLSLTDHRATHTAATFDSSAEVFNVFIGGRANYEIAPNLEIFGRAGRTVMQVLYDKYAVKGDIANRNYTGNDAFDLVGAGFGVGFGAEWFFRRLSVAGSYTYHDLVFDELVASGTSHTLAKDLQAGVNQIAVTVAFHFGGVSGHAAPRQPDESPTPAPAPLPAPAAAPGSGTALR